MSVEPAFWDSSAVVPLCVRTQAAAHHWTLLRATAPVVWWGTSVEVVSAIRRSHREAALLASSVDEALARLEQLRLSWREVAPDDVVRAAATDLLGRHQLRAGDALQLASALVWCGQRPRHRKFLAADQRLGQAAAEAGFDWIQL